MARIFRHYLRVYPRNDFPTRLTLDPSLFCLCFSCLSFVVSWEAKGTIAWGDLPKSFDQTLIRMLELKEWEFFLTVAVPTHFVLWLVPL